MDLHIDLQQLDLNEYFRPPNHLICPVCLDLFKQPCLLLCSHTICKECIDGIVKNANNRVAGFDLSTRTEPGDIPCPVCRSVSKVGLIGQLPHNRALEEAVDHWRENSSTSRLRWLRKTIARCVKHGEKANYWCKNCDVQLCFVCKTKFDHDGHECVAIDNFDDYCEQKARSANEWFDVHSKGVELANHADYLAARYTQISQAHSRWLVEVSLFHRQAQDLIHKKFSALRSDVNKRYFRSVRPLANVKNATQHLSERIRRYLNEVCRLFQQPGMPHRVDISPGDENIASEAEKVLQTVDYNKVAERMLNANDMMADSAGQLARFVQYIKDFNLGDKSEVPKSCGDAVRADLEAPSAARYDYDSGVARPLVVSPGYADGLSYAFTGDAATLEYVIPRQGVARPSQRGALTRRPRRPFPFHS